jgi:hypothetical protein
MDSLPRELQMKIISKLDIDSRRALGVYTRLKIPLRLSDEIGRVISNKPIRMGSNEVVTLRIGSTSKYHLVKGFDVGFNEHDQEIDGMYLDYWVVHDVRKNNYMYVKYQVVWCLLDDPIESSGSNSDSD